MAKTPVPLKPPAEDDGEWTAKDTQLYESFHTAAAALRAESDKEAELDVLLRKSLYADKMPKQLRGQKAADAFQTAFELIGGVPRLALWADKNPSAFFALYSKLIPTSVQAQVQGTIKIDAPWMNPNRLAYMNDQTIEMAEEVPPTPPTPPSLDNGS